MSLLGQKIRSFSNNLMDQQLNTLVEATVDLIKSLECQIDSQQDILRQDWQSQSSTSQDAKLSSSTCSILKNTLWTVLCLNHSFFFFTFPTKLWLKFRARITFNKKCNRNKFRRSLKLNPLPYSKYFTSKLRSSKMHFNILHLLRTG